MDALGADRWYFECTFVDARGRGWLREEHGGLEGGNKFVSIDWAGTIRWLIRGLVMTLRRSQDTYYVHEGRRYTFGGRRIGPIYWLARRWVPGGAHGEGRRDRIY
jgi:hypothetical protein